MPQSITRIGYGPKMQEFPNEDARPRIIRTATELSHAQFRLLMLITTFEPDTVEGGVPLAQAELALLVNTDRRSVSLCLKALEENEYIVRSRPAPRPRERGYRAPISNALRTAVMERDAYRCVTCGTHLNLTLDHIIPISKGGTNDLENLQTMCRSDNASKGARL